LNEITDLITFLKTRIKQTKQTNSNFLPPTQKNKEEFVDKKQDKKQETSEILPTNKDTTIENSPTKQIITEKDKDNVGGKNMSEENIIPQVSEDIIKELDKRIWIRKISIERHVVKRGNKQYFYIRKRVVVPNDFDDIYVVMMTRKEFIELVTFLANKLGISINNEKIHELLGM